jgi:hypothetical protein
MSDQLPHCDMDHQCEEPVSMIDDGGFVYCTTHGQTRQASPWCRCRKLRPHEVRRLKRGLKIERY